METLLDALRPAVESLTAAVVEGSSSAGVDSTTVVVDGMHDNDTLTCCSKAWASRLRSRDPSARCPSFERLLLVARKDPFRLVQLSLSRPHLH